MPTQPDPSRRVCSLLLFVAVPAEEEALEQAAQEHHLPFEKIQDPRLGEYHWLGAVGNETVLAVRPSRERGRVVMGALGRLGSAARAIRFSEATGARGIVQLGMAFGIDPQNQRLGDVLVSTSLIPYDNRDIRLAQPGVKAAVEVYRPATVLGSAQTEMNLHFTENGKAQALETVVWDDDLNTGLIHLGVRSVTPEQEAERFALGLRGALRKAERECGNGYLNAVLLEFIRDSELTHYPEIAEILEHAYATRPNHEGNGAGRYNLCREMIVNAISGRARELTDRLNYAQEEAKRILVAALARYLDERFSVSNRRRLGLL